jgi:hypothetical protein
MVVITPGVAAESPPVPPADTADTAALAATGPDRAFAVAQSRAYGPVIGGAPVQGGILVVGDAEKGAFGQQIPWPIVPIHAVLLPDGRVLSYGSDKRGEQTGYYHYDLWDPKVGSGIRAHTTLRNGSKTDLFCNTQTLLLNGNVEMYGGDNLPIETQTFNNHVDLYRASNDSLVRTGTMHRKRWYASSTVLPNGAVFIQGGLGGKDLPEVRTTSGTFRLLTGAPTGGMQAGYPKNFVDPRGRIFGLAGPFMYRINPNGNGSIFHFDRFPTRNIGPMSTSAMFAPGEILHVGGFDGRLVSLIDINGETPTVTPMPRTARPRKWANATVMADGRVFVSGGSAENNKAVSVSYTSEIFDPATNTWSDGPTAQRMRLYHSTSLLMPDGTVMTMGGGVPGPETNKNAEVYYPSYLFRTDGSFAPRPKVSSMTTATTPGRTLTLNSPDASRIERVTLVKMGSVTHSTDMDMRFLDLSFTRTGASTLSAQLPGNKFRTPPGFYMVFAFNGQGVPSMARVVKIGVAT